MDEIIGQIFGDVVEMRYLCRGIQSEDRMKTNSNLKNYVMKYVKYFLVALLAICVGLFVYWQREQLQQVKNIQSSKETVSKLQDSIQALKNDVASLQDSVKNILAKNPDLDVQMRLNHLEKEVEKYRWDFGQTVNDYNDKMSHWLAFLTIILAVVAIGGPYLSNKWSEKNIEKLLKDADKKAETAQTKAEKVVESVKTDADTAKEHAKNAEEFVNAAKEHAENAKGFVNDAKKEAENAEGILSTAKEQAEKSLAVINELKTQIVNELTPLKETANKSETLLNSIQEYFEKIKNNHVENTSDIGEQQIQKEDNH